MFVLGMATQCQCHLVTINISSPHMKKRQHAMVIIKRGPQNKSCLLVHHIININLSSKKAKLKHPLIFVNATSPRQIKFPFFCHSKEGNKKKKKSGEKAFELCILTHTHYHCLNISHLFPYLKSRCIFLSSRSHIEILQKEKQTPQLRLSFFFLV